MSRTPNPAARARILARIAFATALLLALPATAARVEKVRVGTHPTFTRVVFELDKSAGYSVTRETVGGAASIVVTLDAASEAHTLRSSGDIRTVRVAKGASAVARIALRKPGLRLQEMILANPPRIVFDVMRAAPPPKAAAATAKTVAPKPARRPTAPRAAKPKPVEPVVAKSKPATAPPIPKAKAKTKDVPTPAGVPTQLPTPRIARKTPAPPVVEPKAAPAPVPMPAQPKPVVPAPPVVAPALPVVEPAPAQAAAEPPAAGPDPLRGEIPPPMAATPPAPKPVRKTLTPTPTPAPAPAAPQGLLAKLTGDPLWMGGSAAAVLGLVAIVFLMLRRRRALPTDLDVTAIAQESQASGRNPADGFAMGTDASEDRAETGESPLSSLFADAPAKREPRTSTPDKTGAADEFGLEDAASTSTVATASAENSLFDDDTSVSDNDSQGDAKMSQDLSDLPADPGSVPPLPPPAAAAADTDVARLVQDLERRMSGLEAKLDEANEARERLERQVAAQSEELRVQRAAIARTQRALRTMSSSDEEKATEPALRDGDTQAKTRVNV